MNKEEQIKKWFENNKNILLERVRSKTFLEIFLEENYINELYGLLCKVINQYSLGCMNFIKKNNVYHLMGFILIIQNRSFNKSFNDVLFTLEDMLIKKNSDYGSSFDKSINKFGWVYVAIELDKKKNRLHSLLKNKEKPNYESIEDTLLDIAGYCVLSLIYLENKEA